MTDEDVPVPSSGDAISEQLDPNESCENLSGELTGCLNWKSGMEELQRAFLINDKASIRAAFNRNCVWFSWAQYELMSEDFQELESLFTRCLKANLSIPLWRLYLYYVRCHQLPPLAAEDESTARKTMLKAYDFAVTHVGLDVGSGPIWREYIEYAQNNYEMLSKDRSGNSYEQQQLMDVTRKAYHRALGIPMQGLERLWQAYDFFENSLNKVTAKKLVSERSSAYMSARGAYGALQDMMDALDLDEVIEADRKSESIVPWMSWIEWERHNHLKLVDKSALHSRIVYAFRRALMPHRFNFRMWLNFVKYLRFDAQRPEEAEQVAKQALRICPLAVGLAFALVDIKEGNPNASSEELELARKPLDATIDCVHKKLDELKEKIFETQHWDSDDVGETAFESQLLLWKGLGKMTLEQDTEEGQALIKRYCQMRAEYNQAQCQLLSLCRRTSGLNAARAVFAQARKSAHSTASLFHSAAELEFRFRKDAGIATKIYELGLARFPTDWGFARKYLHHLLALNDDSNIRALFERVQGNLETFRATHHRDFVMAQESDPAIVAIWKDFYDFELQVGDYASISKLEARMRESLTPDNANSGPFSPVQMFINRYGIAEGEREAGDEPESMPSMRFNQKRRRRNFIESLPFYIPEPLFGLSVAVRRALESTGAYQGPEIDLNRFIRFVERLELPSAEAHVSRSGDISPRKRDHQPSYSSRSGGHYPNQHRSSEDSSRRRNYRDQRDDRNELPREAKHSRSSLFEDRRRQ